MKQLKKKKEKETRILLTHDTLINREHKFAVNLSAAITHYKYHSNTRKKNRNIKRAKAIECPV